MREAAAPATRGTQRDHACQESCPASCSVPFASKPGCRRRLFAISFVEPRTPRVALEHARRDYGSARLPVTHGRLFPSGCRRVLAVCISRRSRAPWPYAGTMGWCLHMAKIFNSMMKLFNNMMMANARDQQSPTSHWQLSPLGVRNPSLRMPCSVPASYGCSDGTALGATTTARTIRHSARGGRAASRLTRAHSHGTRSILTPYSYYRRRPR